MTPESITDEVKASQRKELDEAIGKAHLDPAVQVEPRIGYGHPAQVLIDESRSARPARGRAAAVMARSPEC